MELFQVKVTNFSVYRYDYRTVRVVLLFGHCNKHLSQWPRLENEHLNNAGKFRAVNPVPLPFDEVDEVE